MALSSPVSVGVLWGFVVVVFCMIVVLIATWLYWQRVKSKGVGEHVRVQDNEDNRNPSSRAASIVRVSDYEMPHDHLQRGQHESEDSLFCETRSVLSRHGSTGHAPPHRGTTMLGDAADIEHETHPDLNRLNSLSSRQSFQSLHGPKVATRDWSKSHPLPDEPSESEMVFVDVSMQVTNRSSLSPNADISAVEPTPGQQTSDRSSGDSAIECSAADEPGPPRATDARTSSDLSLSVLLNNNNQPSKTNTGADDHAQRELASESGGDDGVFPATPDAAAVPRLDFNIGNDSSNPIYELSRGPSQKRCSERSSTGVTVAPAPPGRQSSNRSRNPMYKDVTSNKLRFSNTFV
ncbi:uncharacterized protein LOC135828917 [Sycon ciliatum]|uniref:uncharacterized protein LOC135828917 n=1 Tax=Sycon ciliatum TaxID=27933 RepID=UPI0031F6CB90